MQKEKLLLLSESIKAASDVLETRNVLFSCRKFKNIFISPCAEYEDLKNKKRLLSHLELLERQNCSLNTSQDHVIK